MHPQFKNEAAQIERQKNVIYGIGKGYVNNSKYHSNINRRWKSFDTSANQSLESQFENYESTFSYQGYQYDNQYYQQQYPEQQF
jgi:hypothetical protein